MRRGPGSLRLLLRYLRTSLAGQLEYRLSFAMLATGQFLITFVDFLGIVVLFERFGTLRGWSLPEVAFLYGLVNSSFALADMTSTGFDRFGGMVKSGDFDRLLLRPRSTLLQLAGQRLELRRLGRLLQGLVVLGWAASRLELAWTPAHVGLLLASLLGGWCLFYGLVVLQATMAFWTTESLEVMNAFTYGGVTAAQYPLEIYRGWFRRFFTLVIPLGCVSYLPARVLLGRVDAASGAAWLGWLAPLAGLVFLAVAGAAWQVGLRRYTSTGS